MPTERMSTSHHIKDADEEEEDEKDENAGVEEDEGSQTDFNISAIKLGASSKQDVE